jgi:hypothetical protein
MLEPRELSRALRVQFVSPGADEHVLVALAGDRVEEPLDASARTTVDHHEREERLLVCHVPERTIARARFVYRMEP